jgi:hypothetical protein
MSIFAFNSVRGICNGADLPYPLQKLSECLRAGITHLSAACPNVVNNLISGAPTSFTQQTSSTTALAPVVNIRWIECTHGISGNVKEFMGDR